MPAKAKWPISFAILGTSVTPAASRDLADLEAWRARLLGKTPAATEGGTESEEETYQYIRHYLKAVHPPRPGAKPMDLEDSPPNWQQK